MTSHRPNPSIERLASRASADIARLLEEAYNIGREDMRLELVTLLSPSRGNDNANIGEASVIGGTPSLRTAEKAPPGTVKPRILKIIEDAPSGLRTEQILSVTGFKENSVRGTLSNLSKEGKIERRGEYWIKKTEAPASEPAEAP
jgi:hypothetical protein